MSLAGTTAASRHRDRPTAIAVWGANALFALLVIVDVVRTLRHAMWRDEMEIYIIAARSASPSELLHNIRYENHPALWYALVWLVTRVTSDPIWMQVLHVGLGLGVWYLVYFHSPFSRLEKILLLLSYFLFWEYFVVSRNYSLIALLTFTFIALREQQPRRELLLWLLLGLLANSHLYGAIWSMVLAAALLLDDIRGHRALAGATLYLALLAFAIYSMAPPPDFVAFARPPLPRDLALWGHALWFNISNVDAYLTTPVGAFAPFSLASLRAAIAFVLHPVAVATPDFWNIDATDELVALTYADVAHPIRLALVFASPVALCWLIVRERLLVFQFTLVYVGIIVFNDIWDAPGSARHHGLIFLALVAAAWSARSRRPPPILSRWLFAAILAVNACGGLLSLASELRPFSEGYDAAVWIRQNHLDDAFLIGSRDARVQTVAGYLRRPVYYLECECALVASTRSRVPFLTPEQFGERLTKAAALADGQDTILIRHEPVDMDELASTAPTLSLVFLASFTNASTDEKFWIYRVNLRSPP